MKYPLIRPALFALLVVLLVVPSLAISQETETLAPGTDSEEANVPVTDVIERSSPPGSDKVEVADEEAILRVWNRHIVELRAHVGGLDPVERAEQAIERITSLPDALLRDEVWSEVAYIREMDFMLIGVKDQVLLALRPEDLEPTSDQTLDELGVEVANRIRGVLRAEAEQRHWPTLLRGIGFSSVATAIFVLLMWGVVRVRSRVA